jgi:hypothetical protein
MSNVKVVAIEPVNGQTPGSRFEVSEREARQLIDKKLVKMDAPVSNKMKPQAENKANPSPAAGKAQTSSALPAARASAKKTVTKSVAGAKVPKTGE